MGEFDCESPGSHDSSLGHHCLMTVFLTPGFSGGTSVDGQIGWGGTGLKWYQARPKVNSGGTEIHRRV